MKDPGWYRKPMILSAVQCNYGEDSDVIMKDHVLANHFNGEQLFHLSAHRHVSFYDEARDGARLDAYLENAKKHDLIEILYWNVHCGYPVTKQAHPDWIQKNKTGRDITAYGSQYLICINSSWSDEYFRNLETLCSHAIDGIFLDGPIFVHNSCYCSSCRAQFRDAYGKDMEEATYQEFLCFRVDSITRMVKKTYEMVKRINPSIMVYLNNSALRADVTGNNTEKIYPYVDFLGTEGGFVWINKTYNYLHTTSQAKYIEKKAKGKPYFIFIAGDYKPFSYCMHTAEETKRLYALSLASGANIWYGIHGPTRLMDSPGGKAAAEFNRFIADHEEYFTRTESRANIALLWSNATANYYASSVDRSDFTEAQKMGQTEQRGNHHHSLLGFFDMLTRSHIQFDVLDTEAVFDGRIRDYQLLILPTYACIGDQEARLLEEYVECGGNLLASFDTGMYDENGTPRETGCLDNLMGIRRKSLLRYQDHGVGYSLFSDGEKENLFPFGGSAWELETSARILAKNSPPMTGRYEALPEQTIPYVVSNVRGKGRTVFIAGTMGEFWYEWATPEHRIWLARTVGDLAEVLTVTNAPPAVEFTLRRQGRRHLLHAVNMAGGPSRPLEQTIPIRDIEVEIRGIGQVSALFGLCAGIPFSWESIPGGILVHIPLLRDHEIIVIEQEEDTLC